MIEYRTIEARHLRMLLELATTIGRQEGWRIHTLLPKDPTLAEPWQAVLVRDQ